MAIVTLDEAKRHLRLPPTTGSPAGSPLADDELDLQAKIDAAEALVLDYVAQRRTDVASPLWVDQVLAWDATTVPPVVKAAVLIQVGELYRFRGDDVAAETPGRAPGTLAPFVVALLHRYRDPALA